MAFFKVLKTKAYFKRYQVKLRRRREGKTDYYQRKRLIAQDKDRYNVRKYRLIVRITNKYVICQIAYSTITGDVIVTQANSNELKKYGIAFGLNNYAAAYATGLLVSRRHLCKLDLASKHKGLEDAKNIGQDFNNLEEVDGNRAFKVVLDIGLARSTTGAKIFGAMKGALDGGLNIPHDPKRFVGNSKDGKEYNAEVHRQHIYGVHVASYMKQLKESDPAAYQKQFSQYIKLNINPDDIEQIYKQAHEKIRANSTPETRERPAKSVQKAKSSRQIKREARAVVVKRRERIERKKAAIIQAIQASA